jgi:hypothetical protein
MFVRLKRRLRVTSDREDRPIHFYVDGPNIDSTLGTGILHRIPRAEERPDWEHIRSVVMTRHNSEYDCFVLNGDRFTVGVAPLYRALLHMGYDVHAPRHEEWCQQENGDPVDEYIRHQIVQTVGRVREGELRGIMLASHDGGYAGALSQVLGAGGTVGVVGFKEWMSPALIDLRNAGAHLFDLEHDFYAFKVNLGRPVMVEPRRGFM